MEIVHVVAINPYRKGNKGKVFSYNIGTYDKVIESAAVKKMIQQIRGELPIDGVDLNDAQAVKKAQERLKSELPFFCPHYGMFKNNVRRQENALPESFLFQTIIDVDDKEYVEKAIEKARELNCSSGIWNGSLLHLCYSARKKLHIGIRMPIGLFLSFTGTFFMLGNAEIGIVMERPSCRVTSNLPLLGKDKAFIFGFTSQ